MPATLVTAVLLSGAWEKMCAWLDIAIIGWEFSSPGYDQLIEQDIPRDGRSAPGISEDPAGGREGRSGARSERDAIDPHARFGIAFLLGELRSAWLRTAFQRPRG